MKFESKIIWISLIWSLLIHSCQCVNSNMTAIVILHGTDESINNGKTNDFYKDLTQILTDGGLDDYYKVINLGLSDNDTEDQLLSTFTSLYFQSDKLCNYVKQNNIWQQLVDSSRIVLVGCSQGAVLIRGLLRDNCLGSLKSKVDKLITFGGPNSGIFGVPPCSQFYFSNDLMTACNLLEQLYSETTLGPSVFDELLYGSAQAVFSPASYWNDPVNPLQLTTYLAKIDNKLCDEPKNKYLCQLKRGLDLIAFGDDEIILPNISAFFGFWDSNGENPIPYNETDLYKNDWIGLKKLDQKNLITFHTIPNATHLSIPYNFAKNEFLNIVNNNNDKTVIPCNPNSA